MSSRAVRNTRPSFGFELKQRDAGFRAIAGIDEAGRGALAGPVVAAATVLPLDASEELTDAIDDSKRLTVNQRETVYRSIKEHAISFGVGVVDADRIDEIGIVPATKLAMRQAVKANRVRVDFLLIDAVERIGIATPSLSIIRGDSQSLSIAAASIIAKVTRDRIMAGEMHDRYPDYRFDKHKGYGTSEHMRALDEFGPSQIHRRSFNPVARLIADASWGALGATMAENIAGRAKLTLGSGLGRSGEDAAVDHIRNLGYRILERNYRTGVGEIDVIARDGDDLVFIEVKSRNSKRMGEIVENFTPRKLRRIESAAIAYLASEIGTEEVNWRIDFVGVFRSPDGQSMDIELIRNVHY